jgi:ABC-type polysaccharide/polyol phosphate export permease
MSETLRGAWAIVQRDARVFRSYRQRPFLELVAPVLAVALFYEVAQLVSSTRFRTPGAYFEFAAVGLALTPMLRASLVAPAAALREEMLAGTFERLALSPLGAPACLVATLVFPLSLALVSGLVILAVAAGPFGLAVDWPGVLLAGPLGALTALALAPFGTLLLAAGVLFKQVGPGSGWLAAALALVGGVYFPSTQLPGWIGWASDVQPLTSGLDLLRSSLTGAALSAPVGQELVTIALFAVIGLPCAAAVLSMACTHARRRGNLLDP